MNNSPIDNPMEIVQETVLSGYSLAEQCQLCHPAFNLKGYQSLFCIYGFHNIITDKWYIGQTTNFINRKRNHLSLLKNNHHENRHLQTAFTKYKLNAFEWYILEECFADIVDTRESFWISYYKSMNRNFGYNSESGGRLNKHISHQAQLNMKDAQKKRKRSNEIYRKISEALKGRKLPDETKLKISLALKGRKKHPFSEETKRRMSMAAKGKRISEETRKKLSDSHKGKIFSEETRQRMRAGWIKRKAKCEII